MKARHVPRVGAVVAVVGLLTALSYSAYRMLRQDRTSHSGAKGNSLEPTEKSATTVVGAPVPAPSPQTPISLPVESLYSAADRAKALELLNVLKQNANISFQEGRFEDALRGYQDCIEVTSVLGAAETEAVKTEQVVRANVVMVCIRLHEYDAARAAATLLLQDAAIALPEDLKVKVLYRRGLASRALHDREAALADFKAAVYFSKDQKNAAVEKEIALLQRGEMITPVFECSQENGFVIVRIFLSAICKVMSAVFDIQANQFTFHCSPYYLRLRFDQCLQEDKGERATYDLEMNVLTVYLPKVNGTEFFTQLDNPAYLIATEKQRASLIQVLGDAPSTTPATDETGAIEEVEYVQSLPDMAAKNDVTVPCEGLGSVDQCGYGFANAFTGLFCNLDADVVREVVSLRDNPDRMPREERRRLRLVEEMNDFDEDALLLAFEDTEGDVARVLRYVPPHIQDFQRALQESTPASAGGPSSSVVFASIPDLAECPSRQRDIDALEDEEETTLLAGDDARPVTVWCGNVAEFKRPLIEEVHPTDVEGQIVASLPETTVEAAASSLASQTASSVAPSPAPRTRLAIPRVRPPLKFTREESEVLMRLKLPRLLFPPSTAEVEALTSDLLFSEAYDDLVTEGGGCSESLWNITKLSPALSYLDPPDTIYDACVAFGRRALVYPLHRHCALLQRVWAVVGTRLLLGRNYTVRTLLRIRMILSHAEHKHLLSTIYLDPLVAYWMHVPDADERLMRMALEIHQHVSRTEPMTVTKSGVAGVHAMLNTNKVTLYPLTLLYLGLPLSDQPEDIRCES